MSATRYVGQTMLQCENCGTLFPYVFETDGLPLYCNTCDEYITAKIAEEL
jgi:uncharacterized Zn finger protein (UPF0148 family)